MIYIGIDPGKDGALAVICHSGAYIIQFAPEAYKAELKTWVSENVRCCLEKVWTMPGQGHKSQGALMENFGFILGLLTAFSIPFQLVPPRVWKGEFGLNSDKEKSIEVCKRLFPGVSIRRTDRCRKDHDGMAEALLMAEYARRRM